jgi:hypothetical protein
VWEPNFSEPEPSYFVPIPDPGTEPDAEPTVCIRINKLWAPILAGCAMQVAQPPSWAVTDPALLDDLLARAQVLVNIIGLAVACVNEEDGTEALTILAGNGTVSFVLTFTKTYLTAPVVLVSTNDIALTASWSAVNLTTVTLHLTSSVPVVADTVGIVSYLVRQ